MGLRPADAARLGIDHAPTVPADVRAAVEERGVRDLAEAIVDERQAAAEREQAAQEEVVRALHTAGVLFCAVPNGGARSQREGAALQRAGVQAGFPDLLIIDRPTVAPADRCPTCWRPSISYDGHGNERRDDRECLSRLWGQPCEGERRPVGVALEMKAPRLRPKTARAGRWSGARPEQREWLAALGERGWVAIVAYGADDALRQLREMGYAV